jgi:peptide-methionine (S)-S-oxide reductase
MLTEVAILAAGCFWGVEDIFRNAPGVLSTEVGYTGGSTQNPTYLDVKTGKTGHAEAIQIQFNPQQTTYSHLLKLFFKMHDPTTLNQQGNDLGSQYRSAIFYTSEEQKKTALSVIAEENQSGFWKKPLVTEVTKAGPFYSAEDYHQDYLKKNPNGYTCHFIRK